MATFRPPSEGPGAIVREELPRLTAEQLEQQSAVRAKAAIRRRARANRARFLWTFTYAVATYDWESVSRDVDAMERRLAARFGRVFFLWVAEPHPGGHGYHLHGVTNRFLSIEAVRAAWGRGHVWVGDDQKKNARWMSRKLARYLAKYIGKSMAGAELYGCAARPKWGKRYWGTHGYEEEPVQLVFPTAEELEAWLLANYGRPDVRRPFGESGDWPIKGIWYSFPDACLGPPPRPP